MQTLGTHPPAPLATGNVVESKGWLPPLPWFLPETWILSDVTGAVERIQETSVLPYTGP